MQWDNKKLMRKRRRYARNDCASPRQYNSQVANFAPNALQHCDQLIASGGQTGNLRPTRSDRTLQWPTGIIRTPSSFTAAYIGLQALRGEVSA